MWETGSHDGFAVDTEAEGATKEVRLTMEDGDKGFREWQSHDTVVSGKLLHAIRRMNACEGGKRLLLGEVCTKTGWLVADVLGGGGADTRIPQVGGPWCSAFKIYKGVPDMAPLNFSEDNVIWVASKLSGVSGEIESESL